jgi:hypothetical protein
MRIGLYFWVGSRFARPDFLGSCQCNVLQNDQATVGFQGCFIMLVRRDPTLRTAG